MSDTFAQNPHLTTLANASGMEVTLMDWGATILSIKVPVAGQLTEMLIGPSKPEDYAHQLCYMGATIGRYANRIDKGRFTANGKEYVVGGGADVVLHGGQVGFDKKRFTLKSSTKSSATYTLHSPDGEEGFPGNFDLTVHFALGDDGALRIDYEATCDQECPACITNHSYFNLNGYHSSVLNHVAQFKAKHILPIDSRAIPTGELYDVTTAVGKVDNFNFTAPKILAHSPADFEGDSNMAYTHGYDHCYVIDQSQPAAAPCVTIKGGKIGTSDKQVELQVYTDYPAFQFYSGCAINDGTTTEIAYARDDGKPYQHYEGFCIEPEFYPDAPHLTKWQEVNPIVSPNAPLKRFITYKFTVI